MSDVREKLIDLPLIDKEWLASSWRGWRNGMMAGVRIRLPYIFHAAIFAVVFRDPGYCAAPDILALRSPSS